MKKLLKPISLAVLFQFFTLFATAQFTCLFSDTAQYNLPDDAKELYSSKNGWHLPANGTLRVLFVFVEIEYDVGIDPNPNGTNEWPVNALPVWANNFLDPQIPTGQSNGLLTQYYQEASFGNYNLIGDYLVAPNNGGVFKILKSQASSVGHENAAINKINQELNGNVVTANGLNSISYFDNWTKTTPGKPKITPSIDSPHKWDHIMFIWRNRLDGQGNPYNGTGNAAYWSIGTPLLGYLSDSYSNFGSFKSIPLAIARHEYAHLLYGHNNFHSAGGGWGAPSSYPYDYWIPLTGGWSVLGLSGSSLQTWNAWDRQRMDWKAPGNSFNISARNAANTTEVNGDLDATYANGAGIYTLRDFVTTGDAIRIKLPFTDPADEFPEFLWIENHNGAEHNGSPFDKWQFEEAACVEPFVAGMMAYIQIDKDTRESSNYNAIYGGYANYTRPLSANGRFDRSFESASTFNDCVQWGETWAFTEGLPNPLTGGCEEEHYTVNVDNNNVIGQSDQRLNFTEKINDTYYKHLYELGATNHVFTLSGNKKISIASNPTSASQMNLVGQNSPAPNQKNLRKIYLNGVSVEIIACDANKNLQVQIRFDDVDIDRDVRWCADEIVLNPIVTESGYSLNVKAGKTITLDQSLTATRMDNPIVFNGENVFADPTTFVVKPDAKINLEPNAKIQLKNNSTMHLNTASYCVVGNNGNIEVKSGTTFYIDDCGMLEIIGNGKLIVRTGATLCISPNAVLAFENGLQNLILESGVIIPSGYVDPILLINNTLSNHTINTNTTWTSENYVINGNLTIEPQTTLYVQTSILSFVDKNSNIIVKPGGELILNGTTLTTTCNESWQGIQVWGNSTASQLALPGQPNPQGKLVLKNEATIENAVNAVTLWKPGDWNTNGGIVLANDARFINNRRSVEFRSYQNIHPVSGDPMGNVSRFTACHFEVNDDYSIADDPFSCHISMFNVDGIQLTGNSFLNQMTEGGNSGAGIISIDANYRVVAGCNSFVAPCPPADFITNHFEGFAYGIDASATTPKTIYVRQAEFVNNGYGIRLNALNNATIIQNNFSVGAYGKGDWMCGTDFGIGIELAGCNNYAVEENTFTPISALGTIPYMGIRVFNDDQLNVERNEIYFNTFNQMSRSNQADGINYIVGYPQLGLNYRCNQNTNNYFDFVVTDQGIAGHQTSLQYAADNTFTAIAQQPTDPRHFFNDAVNPITYHYRPGLANAQPLYVYNVTSTPLGTVPPGPCTSNYGGGNEEVDPDGLTAAQKQYFEQELTDSHTAYTGVKNLYASLLDGGNTDAVQSEIAMAWPEDMWELRAELLGLSPLLSKDVLVSASDRTDVLPESIIFEVLSANPDELKKKELMEHLETKDNPLPEYMIEILESLTDNVTYKTILQSQMAHYGRMEGRATGILLRDMLRDSTTTPESIRTFMAERQSLPMDMQRVDSYLESGETAQALALAASLPQQYTLDGEALAEHGRFVQLKQLQAGLHNQGRNIFQLTPTEKQQLEELIEQSSGTAGRQARSILAFVYEEEFCDCPADINPELKARTFVQPPLNKLDEPQISVRPNPAKTWVSFDYTVPGGSNNAMLEIRDAGGKLVYHTTLENKQGQYVWDTRNIAPGLYHYTLQTTHGIKTGKVTIIK